MAKRLRLACEPARIALAGDRRHLERARPLDRVRAGAHRFAGASLDGPGLAGQDGLVEPEVRGADEGSVCDDPVAGLERDGRLRRPRRRSGRAAGRRP